MPTFGLRSALTLLVLIAIAPVAWIVSAEAGMAPDTSRHEEIVLGVLALLAAVAAVAAWILADRILLRPMRDLLAVVDAVGRERQPLDQPPARYTVREFTLLHRRFHELARAYAERAVLRDAAVGEMEHGRRLLEAVLESMREGVIVMDTHGGFVLVNASALRILPGLAGQRRRPAGSSGDWEVYAVQGGERVPVQQLPMPLALAGHPVERFRYRISGALVEGQDKIIEGSAWPLATSDGPPAGAVVLFSDATSAWRTEEARGRAEEALRHLNETLERRVEERTRELAAANEELESFSYSVSHDLRAPLQVIDGFSQALATRHGEDLDPRTQHYLQRIRDNARQMGQLIDDLIGLARVTRAELVRERFDLAVTAHLVVERLRHRFPQRQVHVDIEEPLPCVADSRLLAIVLENLVGNAWKFTSRAADARIRIGAARLPGGRAFFVADNGAGFDMAYQDKLFKPFQRLHAATEFEGTGIGLATVQRIVVRHGGRVWAESTPGVGTTFFFTLSGDP